MRSSKNRKFVTGSRYSGEANLEMSLPFSKSLAISTLSNHTKLIRSNFSSVYLHPSIGCSTFSKYLLFFFFFEERRIQLVSELLPRFSRLARHFRESGSSWESILTTFKFYNTFREYTSRYTSSHLFQKFSLEKIYILDRIKMQRILKF